MHLDESIFEKLAYVRMKLREFIALVKQYAPSRDPILLQIALNSLNQLYMSDLEHLSDRVIRDAKISLTDICEEMLKHDSAMISEYSSYRSIKFSYSNEFEEIVESIRTDLDQR